MKKIGYDFDEHGKITLPRRACDSCRQEFFFLTTIWQNKKRHRCCNICKDLESVDESTSKDALLRSVPSRIPIMMGMFAAFGIMLMIAGFVYVLLVAPQQESSILHVIIGSCMSGAGFMLARRMVRVRNMILGKNPQPTTESLR